jgi:ABC-type phosphate transport system substrate-binding protein
VIAKRASLLLPVAMALLAISAQAQNARDYITVVGSSTVFPFTTAVAQRKQVQADVKALKPLPAKI